MKMWSLLANYVSNEAELIVYLSYVMIGTALATLIALQCVDAPYGRYGSTSWGPNVPGKIAWFIQELPCFMVPVCCILMADRSNTMSTANLVLLAMFLTHYLQRTFIFPFLLRGGKPTPLIPFLLALVFCLYNGYIQGRYLTMYAVYEDGWEMSPQFIIGVVLFVSGMAINIHSDHILRNLRKPGETGYKIPQGGMFEYVSGANFLGEIMEWSGFALAGQTWPAVAFAIFTAANIGPRAMSHHRWYLQKFKETYPKSRRALIPFLL